MNNLSFVREEFKKYSVLVFGCEAENIELKIDPALSGDKDEILIEVKNGVGVIAGSNKLSCLIAVYRFFRECGCRFLRPGSHGEVIKQLPLSAATVSLREKATSDYRCMKIEGAVSYENVYNMIDFCPKIGLNTYEFQFKNSSAFFERWYNHRDNPFKESENISPQEIERMATDLKAEAKKRGIAVQTMGHGWTAFPFGMTSDGWSDDNADIPEDILSCFALKDGKRGLIRNRPFLTQLCYTNPATQQKVADYVVKYCKENPDSDYLMFATADAINNCCECENCAPLRLADQLIPMLNLIDKRLTEEGLPQKIVIASYLETLWAPEKEKLCKSDRFRFGFYPISHVYHEPVSTDIPDTEPFPYELNRLKRTGNVVKNFAFLKNWQKQYPHNWVVGEYHYMWDHYLDLGYQQIARVLSEDIKNQDKFGLSGMEMYQPQRCAFPTAMGLQTFGATLWNKETDFDELSRDYFCHAYGKGWEEVYTYLQTLSDTYDMKIKAGGRDYSALSCIPTLEKCLKLIEDFTASHDFSTAGRSEVEAVSWYDLELHTKYAAWYLKAILKGLSGDEEGGKKDIEELIRWMFQVEDQAQERWDVLIHKGHLPIWYDRLMEQKHNEEQNKKASDLLGEAGNQGVQD